MYYWKECGRTWTSPLSRIKASSCARLVVDVGVGTTKMVTVEGELTCETAVAELVADVVD